MEANQIVHELLTKKDSINIKPNPDYKPLPVFIIDYDNPENNDFVVVNQFKFHGAKNNSIPDIIVYLKRN